MKTIVASLLISLSGAALAEVSAPPPMPGYLHGFEALWASDPRAAGLEWFKQAKFGMFISFSPASQVGQDGWLRADRGWAEQWHARNATLPADKYDRYLADKFDGQLMSPSAEELLRRFTAKNFDADQIADLAVAAGMKYIIFTTQHVLGRMYLFQTETSPLHSVARAPQRDFVAELAKACQARKLGLFLYVGPPYTSTVIRERYRAMLAELLTRYGPVAGIWFDGIGEAYRRPSAFEPAEVSRTYALVRKLQPQCLIAFKSGYIGEEDYLAPEWHQFTYGSDGLPRLGKFAPDSVPDTLPADLFARWNNTLRHLPAETSTTMLHRKGNRSAELWFDHPGSAAEHKSAAAVLAQYQAVRKRNQNFALNVALRGDGSIHPVDERVLREMGHRLAIAPRGDPPPAAPRPPARPNLIFLLTDDQRDGTFGAMGHPWVKTPHVDRLIRDGVRFANTYIAEPSCSPSRTALFSGLHERVNGVGFTSAHRLTEDQWEQTYPALLRKAGYHTGFIGKFGVEYYTFRGRAAEKFDFWRAHDGWARFFPKTAPNCEIYKDSEYELITEVDGDSIRRFLEAAPTDRPFCLSVSFSVPHGSQTTSMFGPADMSVPANRNPKLKGNPFYDTLYRPLPGPIPEDAAGDPYRFIPESVLNQEHGRRKCYDYDYTRPTCEEHHIRYYQQISALDQSIGDMMATLRRKGLATNTVILFTSDNGLLMGEYGRGDKSLLYDLAAKVPCFIHDPRLPKERRGRTDTHLVSSIDLTRTLLDYAGVAAPAHMAGRSLRPLLEQDDAPWREELFLENLLTLRGNPIQEGIRRGRWKYVRFFTIPVRPNFFYTYQDSDLELAARAPDFEQLFDLDADPGERNNLAAIPGGHPQLAALRAACQRHADELNQARAAYRRAFPPAPRNKESP